MSESSYGSAKSSSSVSESMGSSGSSSSSSSGLRGSYYITIPAGSCEMVPAGTFSWEETTGVLFGNIGLDTWTGDVGIALSLNGGTPGSPQPLHFQLTEQSAGVWQLEQTNDVSPGGCINTYFDWGSAGTPATLTAATPVGTYSNDLIIS